MIISKIKYSRSWASAQNGYRYIHDKKYIMDVFHDHIKRNFNEIYCNLTAIDNDLPQSFSQVSVKRIIENEYESPNTTVIMDFGDTGKLRGEFPLNYNRISLYDYFNVQKLQKEEEVIIPYEDWKKAATGEYIDLPNLIHEKFSFRLGKLFSHEGTIIVDRGEQQASQEITGRKPFALIIPSMDAIMKGWRYLKNIQPDHIGTFPLQDLIIRLRLESSNHLLVEDGSIVFTIKLKRPLERYCTLYEECYHVTEEGEEKQV